MTVPEAAYVPGSLENGHPRKWWILAAVSLGMFMALLDATIVNIAIPSILNDLNTTISKVSWVLNAYNLAMVALFLSMGRLADRYGQKLLFIGGLILFTAFSLACGFAPNIAWLIVFRVVQGVGGAAMAPISLSILLGAFPMREHGMAVGIWGGLGAVAAALGPSLGGVLVEYVHWSWIFFINVPVGVIALVMAVLIVPEHRAVGHGSLDIPAIFISAGGLFCFTLALVEGNSWGWTSGAIVALFVIAILALPVFFFWEWRTKSPMFDLRLLRIQSFTMANTATMLISTCMGGTLFLLVIFLQSVLGYSALQAALCITPIPVTGLILAPLIGRLADRIGPRIPAAIGTLFFGAGLVLLAQLNASSTLGDTIWRVILLGFGVGFGMPTLAAASMSSLPPQAAGVGSGSLAMFRQMGFVFGVAVLTAIFTHTAVTAVQTATIQSIAYVRAQPAIPALEKAVIVGKLQAVSVNAANGAGNPQDRLKSQISGIPKAPAGTPAAALQKKATTQIGAYYKDALGGAFMWPFYAAAIAALLALPFALLSGRRLGQFAGAFEGGAGPPSTDSGPADDGGDA